VERRGEKGRGGGGGGGQETDVCREFGLVNSTIQTICKNRTKIVSRSEQYGSRIKRFRNSERSDVDETQC